MMENKDFAIFILTHARPDNIKTLLLLKKCNYTGRIYYIVDNEDKTVPRYIQNFGAESVKIFDKKAMADSIDEGNNFDERRTITHARNACFQIAKEIGVTYFMQLDDDYTQLRFRYLKGDVVPSVHIHNLDWALDQYINFYKKTTFKSIAFSQGGDFIGGAGNNYVITMPLMRKCMNSFLCSTERPFQFVGAMNEDVNTYCTLGSRGELLGTVTLIQLTQTQTQGNKGGITDMYLRFGTYCKAFTTVMMHPSGVKVSMLNSKYIRIHHQIKWINTVPVIIDEKWKKN